MCADKRVFFSQFILSLCCFFWFRYQYIEFVYSLRKMWILVVGLILCRIVTGYKTKQNQPNRLVFGTHNRVLDDCSHYAVAKWFQFSELMHCTVACLNHFPYRAIVMYSPYCIFSSFFRMKTIKLFRKLFENS